MSAWQEVADNEGNTYYWNSETNETSWDAPPELAAGAETKKKKKKNKTAKSKREDASAGDSEGWQALQTDDGKTYYWNKNTNETLWEKPPGFVEEGGPSSSSSAAAAAASDADQGAASTQADAKVDADSGSGVGDWEKVDQDDGTSYFWNRVTNETSWEPPPGMLGGDGGGEDDGQAKKKKKEEEEEAARRQEVEKREAREREEEERERQRKEEEKREERERQRKEEEEKERTRKEEEEAAKSKESEWSLTNSAKQKKKKKKKKKAGFPSPSLHDFGVEEGGKGPRASDTPAKQGGSGSSGNALHVYQAGEEKSSWQQQQSPFQQQMPGNATLAATAVNMPFQYTQQQQPAITHTQQQGFLPQVPSPVRGLDGSTPNANHLFASPPSGSGGGGEAAAGTTAMPAVAHSYYGGGMAPIPGGYSTRPIQQQHLRSFSSQLRQQHMSSPAAAAAASSSPSHKLRQVSHRGAGQAVGTPETSRTRYAKAELLFKLQQRSNEVHSLRRKNKELSEVVRHHELHHQGRTNAVVERMRRELELFRAEAQLREDTLKAQIQNMGFKLHMVHNPIHHLASHKKSAARDVEELDKEIEGLTEEVHAAAKLNKMLKIGPVKKKENKFDTSAYRNDKKVTKQIPPEMVKRMGTKRSPAKGRNKPQPIKPTRPNGNKKKNKKQQQQQQQQQEEEEESPFMPKLAPLPDVPSVEFYVKDMQLYQAPDAMLPSPYLLQEMNRYPSLAVPANVYN